MNAITRIRLMLIIVLVMFPDMFTLVIGSVVALVWWGLARTVLTLRSVKSQPQAAL